MTIPPLALRPPGTMFRKMILGDTTARPPTPRRPLLSAERTDPFSVLILFRIVPGICNNNIPDLKSSLGDGAVIFGSYLRSAS